MATLGWGAAGYFWGVGRSICAGVSAARRVLMWTVLQCSCSCLAQSEPHLITALAPPFQPALLPTHPTNTTNRSDAAELWRPFPECNYRACRLLHRRGRAPLAVHVPSAMTGVDAGSPEDSVRLVGQIVAPLRPGPTPTPVLTRGPPKPTQAPASVTATAAKLRSAAGLAAGAYPAPPYTQERPSLLSPSGSSGSLSMASSSFSSFSGASLRSLVLQGEGSPSPTQGSASNCQASVAPPAPTALPPRPRARFIVRELAPAGMQRVDCAALRSQQQQQQQQAAMAEQQQQQQAMACQRWAARAPVPAQRHVVVP